MIDTLWDWWFGDSPRRRTSLAAVWVHRFGSKSFRRSILAAVCVGTTWVNGATIWAEDGEILHEVESITIQPISFAWASPTNFASTNAFGMIDQQDTDATVTDAEEAGAELDDDERRRQRLRELLREDTPLEAMPVPAGEKKPKEVDPIDPKELEAAAEEGAFAEPFIKQRLPEVISGRFQLPALRAVSIAQEPIGNGKVPDSLKAGEELNLVPMPEDAYARSQLVGAPAWPMLIRPWAAPNTFSHPLYFEDRMLERHGHERWGYLQPVASGARFFATLPMMPYLATVQPPCDIVYSKGYYRAGSPVPRFYQRPPLERRAVIVEAASVAGGFIALP